MPDKEESKEKKFYASAVKEHSKLEKENSLKATTINRAYDAAVAELGYSDKELADTGKAKQVAKLMFSDKYLGSKEFNPLLKGDAYKGFADMSDSEKSTAYNHLLGMDVQTLVGNNGIIDRYGGLGRAQFANATTQYYTSKTVQQLGALAWNRVYDPGKTLDQNMKAYGEALNHDPILSGSGKKIDPMRFESVDDIAQALSTSVSGHSTRDSFQYAHGVKF